MLASVGLLWTIGVVCLLAAAVGDKVKLPNVELGPINLLRARVMVAGIGAVALVLGLVLLIVDARKSSDTAGPTVTVTTTLTQPPVEPTPEPTAPDEPSDPPTSSSPSPKDSKPDPTPPKPRPVQVWWKGSLELGGYGGGPGGGWWLDNSPPGRAVGGDLFYNGTNAIAGNAIIEWDRDGLPKWQQCSDLLESHLGGRSVDVRKGSVACLKTSGERIGYARVDRISDPSDLNPTMTVSVVVWNRE